MGNTNNSIITSVLERTTNEDEEQQLLHLRQPIAKTETIEQLKRQLSSENLTPPGVIKIFIGDQLVENDAMTIQEFGNKPVIAFEVEPSPSQIRLLAEIAGEVKKICFDENNKSVKVVSVAFMITGSYYVVEIPSKD